MESGKINERKIKNENCNYTTSSSQLNNIRHGKEESTCTSCYVKQGKKNKNKLTLTIQHA